MRKIIADKPPVSSSLVLVRGGWKPSHVIPTQTVRTSRRGWQTNQTFLLLRLFAPAPVWLLNRNGFTACPPDRGANLRPTRPNWPRDKANTRLRRPRFPRPPAGSQRSERDGTGAPAAGKGSTSSVTSGNTSSATQMKNPSAVETVGKTIPHRKVSEPIR